MCIVILHSGSMMRDHKEFKVQRDHLQKTEIQACSMSSKLKYLSHFPFFLHQYIYDIVDMGDDENCGFRAIATLLRWGKESWPLIRTQLDTEVYQHHQLFSSLFYNIVSEVMSALQVDGFGVQGREKWMTVPDMGYPIASRYSVILFSLILTSYSSH